MYRFIGILGLLVLLGLAFVFSSQRRSIRLKTVLWGLGRWRHQQIARLLLRGLAVRLRRSRREEFHAVCLRFRGAADHHFHLGVFRCALPLWRDAVCDPPD